MKEQNFNGLGQLGNLRDELKRGEPIKEGVKRTPAMLTGTASKKLLKYFFTEFSDNLKKYIKNNDSNLDFVERIKQAVNNGENLKTEDALGIDGLFLKFIRKIPVSQDSNKGVIFGDMARRAGCVDGEIEEAEELLSSYIEPVLNKIFNK